MSNMIHIIKDFTMFELSIEVIFVISILIILTILSFIPDNTWVKIHKPDWLDKFLHPKF